MNTLHCYPRSMSVTDSDRECHHSHNPRRTVPHFSVVKPVAQHLVDTANCRRCRSPRIHAGGYAPGRSTRTLCTVATTKHPDHDCASGAETKRPGGHPPATVP